MNAREAHALSQENKGLRTGLIKERIQEVLPTVHTLIKEAAESGAFYLDYEMARVPISLSQDVKWELISILRRDGYDVANIGGFSFRIVWQTLKLNPEEISDEM